MKPSCLKSSNSKEQAQKGMNISSMEQSHSMKVRRRGLWKQLRERPATEKIKTYASCK